MLGYHELPTALLAIIRPLLHTTGEATCARADTAQHAHEGSHGECIAASWSFNMASVIIFQIVDVYLQLNALRHALPHLILLVPTGNGSMPE